MRKTPIIDSLAIVGFIGLGALGVWALVEEFQPRPATAASEVQRGTASWYSRAECCTRSNPDATMKNGRPLVDEHYTCASWFHPIGSVVRITSGSKSVECIVTDRGPNKRLVAQGRVIDLTRAAFSRLGDLDRGLVPVTVERVR